MPSPEDFAVELAKHLPVKEAYTDLAQPAAKQSGQLAEDLVKALQLALAPVQLLGALQDRFRRFVDRSVRRVPEDKRVSPAPQIAGPILESIRYESEGTPIDEMFSQLLSRACDSDRASEAHPAFPLLVRQLSVDEAKILVQLKKRMTLQLRQHFDAAKNYFSTPELVQHSLENLAHPENLSMYLGHLRHLGLAGEEVMYRENVPLGQTGYYRLAVDQVLTPFGWHFVSAVMPDSMT